MGINEKSSEGGTKLSLEMFQEIFEKIEPEIHIETYEQAQGSGRGDNYTATLYRTHLAGYHKSLLDGKKLKWEKTVICKRLPDNAARRDAFKSVELFRNEVEFYTRIMPELVNFQKSRNGEMFSSIPQCYYAKNDLIIMEDLHMRKFEMPDRHQGLSLDQTEAVLREIAILHSLSLAYRFQHPKKFEKFKALITEGLFCPTNENWYKKYYAQLTKNAISMVSDVLPKGSKYVQRLAEFTENSSFFSRMIKLVNMESPISVICHGDCWTNNFMFRYDSSGNVSEISLVDFQLIRYGSPALDIANLIFCCTTKEMRKEHLPSLIKVYTGEFYKSLKTLGGPMPDFCDSEEKFAEIFKRDLKSCGKFALGLAMDIIPISTCASEDAPDLYGGRSDEAASAPILNFPPNDLCRQKLTEILIDLVDGGML